ncbi:MAG: hypothetical protein ACKOK8_15350, partial [Planctomycetia bacterium]
MGHDPHARHAAVAPKDLPDLRRAALHEVVEFEVAELVARSRAAIASLGIESVAQVREVFRGHGGMPGV